MAIDLYPPPQGNYPSVRAMVEALRPDVPVYCLHKDKFRKSARAFLEGFPGTTLYAVKCNPHPFVLQQLYDAGIRHFDTASLGEIALIKGLFPDACCYFMHPVKTPAAIAKAYYDHGVRVFVVDHIDEVAKMRRVLTDLHDVILLVRIAPPSTTAVFDFSRKFGANTHEAVAVIEAVQAVGAQVGIAFHIGSQCLTPETFTQAFAVVADVLEETGAEIKILDVGGGFPAAYLDHVMPPLNDFFDRIRTAIESLQLPQDCRVFCEPGRALTAEGCTLVVQVLLRKTEAIYLNDGFYGSFNEVVYGKLRLPSTLIRLNEPPPSEKMMDFVVFGPTCDSVDVLPVPFRLPEDVQEGDWIALSLAGAYTNATVTVFNGFIANTYVEVD
jgi:ornithine decarboxylase